MGNYCVCDGKVRVIEYGDFPDELAHAKNSNGTRKFNSANLGIHLLNVDFVQRVVGESFRLPLMRAEKTVDYVDETGKPQQPSAPNAVKLETLVFDALPLASNTLLLEVDRAEEFSPVKKATGVDSLETAKRDQIARACRWLEAAGVNVPRKPNGEPDVTVAISPSFAIDREDVKPARDRLPTLKAGQAIYVT